MALNGKQIRRGIKFLEWVQKDFQMDKSHKDYCGFINIGAEMFNDDPKDEKLLRGFQIVVENYRLFIPIMEILGLKFEERPELEETVIELINK